MISRILTGFSDLVSLSGYIERFGLKNDRSAFTFNIVPCFYQRVAELIPESRSECFLRACLHVYDPDIPGCSSIQGSRLNR